jgi:hypothetical protein
MRYPAFVSAAALVLPALFLSGGAVAQTTQPQPATMTDTAPLPASERESLGAVIIMDSPVLAQREAMLQAAARAPDTRTMGAGPAELLNRAISKEDAKKKPLEKTPK